MFFYYLFNCSFNNCVVLFLQADEDGYGAIDRPSLVSRADSHSLLNSTTAAVKAQFASHKPVAKASTPAGWIRGHANQPELLSLRRAVTHTEYSSNLAPPLGVGIIATAGQNGTVACSSILLIHHIGRVKMRAFIAYFKDNVSFVNTTCAITYHKATQQLIKKLKKILFVFL